MNELIENNIGFMKMSTLLIGLCNVFFIGSQYQVRGTLDLIYFVVVMTIFIVSLLWTLAIPLIGLNPSRYLTIEKYSYVSIGLLYFGGTICFIVSISKDKAPDEFQGGKIVTCVRTIFLIFGLLQTILYTCGSIFIHMHLSEKRSNERESRA